jgi:protease I
MKVAILATDGFEESELKIPHAELERQGALVEVVSLKAGEIQGWKNHEKSGTMKVDRVLDQVKPEDYAALVLPGGVMNPDSLRVDTKAVDFVRSFVKRGAPIAAICHGPWTLIDAEGVRGRKMTSWPSLKTDLRNAGAEWVDAEVVTDHGMVTSRKPDDLPAFCRKMVEEFEEGLDKKAA